MSTIMNDVNSDNNVHPENGCKINSETKILDDILEQDDLANSDVELDKNHQEETEYKGNISEMKTGHFNHPCPSFTPKLASLLLAARYRVQPTNRANSSVTFLSPNRRSVATPGKRVRRKPKGKLLNTRRVDYLDGSGLPNSSSDPSRKTSSIQSDITRLDNKDNQSMAGDADEDISYRHARLDEGTASQRSYTNACKALGTPVIATVLESIMTTELVLKYHGLDPKAVKACSAALVDNGTVEVLDLRGNHLGHSGVLYVCGMLQENIFITDLSLAENNLGSHGLAHVLYTLNNTESLRSVNLAGNGLTDVDTEAIADMLRENVTLRELDLSYNDFREKGGKRLAEGLVANTSLEVLNLSWNHLRGIGAEAMGRLLEHNVSLKVLNLGWNGFHLDGCRAVGKALGVNSSLEQLDLSCNRINPECLDHLLKGLRNNQCLTHLMLSRNTLMEEGILKFLQYLETAPPSPLVNIDISGPDISKQFLIRLQQILLRNPSLNISYGATSEPDRMIHIQESTLLQMENPVVVLLEYLRIKEKTITDIFVTSGETVTSETFNNALRGCDVPISGKMMTSLLDRLDAQNSGRVNIREVAQEQQRYLARVQSLLSEPDSSERTFGDTDIGRVHNKLKCFLNIRQQFWSEDVGIRQVKMKPYAHKHEEDYLPALPRKQSTITTDNRQSRDWLQHKSMTSPPTESYSRQGSTLSNSSNTWR